MAEQSSNDSPVPAHPVSVVCGKIYESNKTGDHLQTLQHYDELLSIVQDGIPEDDVGLMANIRTSWARALLASQAHLQDDEHAQEILMDFEALLNNGEPCSYLRGVLITGERPAMAVQKYEALKLGPLDSEAVRGCLEQFKTANRTDITELIAILEVLGVEMEPALSEKLQRYYVLRMKDEDPEVVLEEMKMDGLQPTTAHPYNMIFVRPTLSKKTFMQHYEEMVGYGIRPEPSTLRLLLKKNDLSKEDQNNLRWQQKNLTQPRLAPDMVQKFVELCFRSGNAGNVEQASKMFQRFRTEVQSLPTHIFNTMIDGYAREPERAEEVYLLMLQDGVKPNISTYSKLIKIWHQNRLADSMDKWVNEMQTQNIEMDAISAATILDAYVRSNQRGRALQLLVGMLTKDQTQLNNQNMYNIIMKFGPFDFAIGILGCLLSEGLPVSPSAKSTLSNLARDPLSLQFVEELNDCRWDARSILLCDAIMVTQPDQHPSLVDCMRLLMREIKLSPDVIEKRTSMLQQQVVQASS